LGTEAGWAAIQWPGLEHVVVSADAGGWQARSQLILARPGLASVSYQVSCDPDWRFAELTISVASATARAELVLTSGRGGWRADGQPRPDLDGCTDIDINATPLTNTLPIRRLDWRAAAAYDIDVAYVTVPGLAVHRVRQRYTRLRGSQPASSPFRYESGSFRTELQVDAGGLVLDYPGIWRRVSGQNGSAA
jgi:uncharacterized protein